MVTFKVPSIKIKLPSFNTGPCKLHLYDHLNYGGHLATFTESAYNGNPNSNDRDASGIVLGDCKNTTWLGFEHPGESGYAWLLGEGDSIPNFRDATGEKCDVEQHRFYKFHDQNNSIKKIVIPTENVNDGRMREDIKIYAKRRDTRQCEWATYPVIKKTSDGQFSANDNDQWLVGHNDKKGQPCPGGTAYWKGFQKVSCVYDVKSGPKLGRLQTLHGEIKNSFSGDPRKAMYTNIVNRYCNSAERLNDVISSDTSNNKCRDVVNSTSLAKEYCKIGDNIATDNTFCTKEELGTDIYNELAETYCKNNPGKDFCGCYNVTQPGLCKQSPNLPGCKIVKPVWDKITTSLDEGDIAQFEGMQPCYGSVCTGNVYQPTGWDVTCNRDISICKADFDIGGDLVGSKITLKQDCGKEGSNGKTTTENENKNKNKNKDGDDDEEKSLIEKLFKFEEDKDKKLTEKQSTKIFGTVSLVSSCCVCMTALTLLI